MQELYNIINLIIFKFSTYIKSFKNAIFITVNEHIFVKT